MKRSFASATRDISPPPDAKRQNTTKSAARNSFFTPLSQKKVSPTKIDWQIRHETLIMGKYRPQDIRPKPTRIAAFDLDGTLIRVKSGTRFATNAGDWGWLYTKIPGKLRELHAEGNQSRISFDPKAKLYPQWKQKLQAIAETLDVPMMVFAATSKDDWFRKPRVGMWDAYAKEMGISLKDGLEMFYVGDAAGRMGAQSARRIKDHGDTDRKFAMNLKIPFHTPEEYFLGDPPAEFIIGAFNPLSYIPTQTIPSPTDGSSAINSTENISANGSAVPLISPPEKPDIILFVGSPAAGKSTFFRENLAPLGYERINQDTLKTRDRCVAEATALLEKNIPMAIDNTNAEKSTRKFWVDLSRKFSRPIRCIYFTASAQLARHNNLVRALGGKAVEKRKVLPLAAIYSYLQRFQEPTLEEGFTEIVKVDFVFRGTKEEREVWSLWWD